MKKSSLRALCAVAALAAAAPLGAAPDAGAYLAARQAAHDSRYETAAHYFGRALDADPGNAVLLENAMASLVAAGEIGPAGEVAARILGSGHESQVANMIAMARAADEGRWTDLFAALEAGHSVGPLVDGLAQGWGLMALGRTERAMRAFDELSRTEGLRSFALYHKALALASIGDHAGAEALLSLTPEQGMQRTRRGIIARAAVLSQIGRGADAVALIDATFGPAPDATLADLRARLAAGEVLAPRFVRTPVEGLGEVFYSVAGAVEGQTPDSYALLYARLAEFLAPESADARLLSARLLENLGRLDLAAAAYSEVPPAHPAHQAAELGRAGALRDAGRFDSAAEVLRALALRKPGEPLVHASLGDTLRQLGRMDEANAAYSRALDLSADGDGRRWFLHYVRGITFDRLGQWDAAKADFRAALDLRPDQPDVLNYFGYSLVEAGEALDEALVMIRAAAEARPDSGAIRDSLGWVLHRSGRSAEAVAHLERAVELEPLDPVINDHLGDVYWAVGRRDEARFQWRRALSFDPGPEALARIERKLDAGPDMAGLAPGEAAVLIAHDARD